MTKEQMETIKRLSDLTPDNVEILERLAGLSKEAADFLIELAEMCGQYSEIKRSEIIRKLSIDFGHDK